MNELEVRQAAATRVQASCRSYLVRKDLQRKREAAVLIQRTFRKKKDFTAALAALENARRRRRIRKHELESKYLKTLPSDMFENYKAITRNHAALVIQRAWRKRAESLKARSIRTRSDLGAGRGAESHLQGAASTSFGGRGGRGDDYSDAELDLWDESDLKGNGTNSTEYWGLLSQEKKKQLLSEIRRKADRVSEYDKVYSRDDDKKTKHLLQECYESLARFAKLQRAKSRLSKKAALLSNQLIQTQPSSSTMDDMVACAQIDFSSLPPLPSGRRLAEAQREHDTCVEQERASSRNSNKWWNAKKTSSGFHSDDTYQHKSKDVEVSLARHNETMHEKEMQVAQDWQGVNDLVKLARSFSSTVR